MQVLNTPQRRQNSAWHTQLDVLSRWDINARLISTPRPTARCIGSSIQGGVTLTKKKRLPRLSDKPRVLHVFLFQ